MKKQKIIYFFLVSLLILPIFNLVTFTYGNDSEYFMTEYPSNEDFSIEIKYTTNEELRQLNDFRYNIPGLNRPLNENEVVLSHIIGNRMYVHLYKVYEFQILDEKTEEGKDVTYMVLSDEPIEIFMKYLD